jgi:hypothetical protein
VACGTWCADFIGSPDGPALRHSPVKSGRLAPPVSVAACLSSTTGPRRPSKQGGVSRSKLPHLCGGSHHLVPFGSARALCLCSRWTPRTVLWNRPEEMRLGANKKTRRRCLFVKTVSLYSRSSQGTIELLGALNYAQANPQAGQDDSIRAVRTSSAAS